MTATGTYARIGGLEIINGGFGSIASLSVVGAATIGADLAVTGNVTGGGLRKYTGSTAPANPVVGDVWYKSDTDVYYQYINDGTNRVWVDYVSATVADLTLANAQLGYDIQFVSGTLSTSPTSGAVQVIGGVGIIGNINTTGNINATGRVTVASTLTAQSIASNTSIAGATLSISGAASTGELTTGNITGYGFTTAKGNITATGSYFGLNGFVVNNGNITATGTRAVVGGLTIENGGFADLASLAVLTNASIVGNLSAGNILNSGGVRQSVSTTAPANPTIGDQWYQTSTDTLYQYTSDGTSQVWVDISGASIANVTYSAQTVSDIAITSGTPSTSTISGALRVAGGAGVTGNLYSGNLTTGTINAGLVQSSGVVVGTAFTYANGTSILVGNEGTYSNANVTGYLTAQGITTASGNLVATGSYFSAGGLSVTAGNITAGNITGYGFSTANGNIVATGSRAVLGGLTIENGGFGNLASLGITNFLTVGTNLTVGGNITGGGMRKTSSIAAPVNPVIGDVWYKTDTDIYYEYINDGTNNIWVDLTSASVANITARYDNVGDLAVVGGRLDVQGNIIGAANISSAGFVTAAGVVAGAVYSDGYRYANGTSFVSTTVANSAEITANISNGFNLGLSLAPSGVTAGTYGSDVSIPTIEVDSKGRITNVTTNSVSTTVNLTGNIGTGSVAGGGTLVVVGVPNQIQTSVSGNTISIGFTPNITFQDFTVSGNLSYAGGGLRTTTSATPPDGPTNGDMWYQTGTDILYRFVNDGTSEYWLDLFSTPLRAILPERDIGGADGQVQFNDGMFFGANANFVFDKTTGTLRVERFRITKSQSPVTPTSTGTAGEITWDSEWMYVCTGSNQWRRMPLYAW